MRDANGCGKWSGGRLGHRPLGVEPSGIPQKYRRDGEGVRDPFDEQAPGLLPKHDTKILAAIQPLVESVHEVVKRCGIVIGRDESLRVRERMNGPQLFECEAMLAS